LETGPQVLESVFSRDLTRLTTSTLLQLQRVGA
jgi:hypothetical protein